MAVDSRTFKDLMARVAQTVTIVTIPSDEGPAGLTVSAFTSVSAEPPIVLVCIDKKASTLEYFLDGHAFTVNIMPRGTGDIAMLFATRGADRFGAVGWHDVEGSGPILDGAFEAMVCRIVERTEMGDHWVIYGAVEEAFGPAELSANGAEDPLVWLHRGFVHTEPD
jgi:flavin reductase ActVB